MAHGRRVQEGSPVNHRIVIDIIIAELGNALRYYPEDRHKSVMHGFAALLNLNAFYKFLVFHEKTF